MSCWHLQVISLTFSTTDIFFLEDVLQDVEDAKEPGNGCIPARINERTSVDWKPLKNVGGCCWCKACKIERKCGKP